MIAQLAALAVVLAAGHRLPFTVPPALSTASGQALTIEVTPGGSRVHALDSYLATSPVAVRVLARHAGVVALDAVGPDGRDVTIPLAREGAETFSGTAGLDQAGTWSLAVETTADGVTTTSPAFTVSVRSGPSGLDLAVIVVLAVASFGGGIGLIAAGRRSSDRRRADDDERTAA